MTDELLVHISAPTTRHSDNLYQSLADAYLEFKPCKRYGNASSSQPYEQNQPQNATLNTIAASFEEAPVYIATETSMFSISRDSYGSFPSQLSSEDQTKGSLDDDSIPPPSRLAQLERIHANWKQQTTPKSDLIKGISKTRQSRRSSTDADTAFIEDTQLAVQALQSQLYEPCSMFSEDFSKDESRLNEDTQLSQPLDVETGSEDVDKGTPKVLASANIATFTETSHAGADHERVEPVCNTTSRFSSSGDHATKDLRDRKHPSGIESISTPVDFTRLPIDAYPPAPTVSVVHPGTLPSQVTKHLKSIKTQNPARFKPSTQLRVPKSDDRGYWVVQGSHWPEEFQLEFWKTMCEHVISGRLGWGTTLHRVSNSPRTFGQVRLYCWGEVVEHTWLLLWLCSQGKVSGSGLKWFDADGIVTLEAF